MKPNFPYDWLDTAGSEERPANAFTSHFPATSSETLADSGFFYGSNALPIALDEGFMACLTSIYFYEKMS